MTMTTSGIVLLCKHFECGNNVLILVTEQSKPKIDGPLKNVI